MDLYTISKMAKILKIPESTARYYRDRYPDFMLSVESGRKKRYKKETLKVLRIICEEAKRSNSAEGIEGRLSKEFKRNIEVEEETAVSTAVEKQHQFIEVIANRLKSIADQKKEIQELREEVRELRDIVKLPWRQKLTAKRKDKNA